jgi:hypothetical protein
MAIKGKARVTVYLDQDNYETVKNYLDSRPGAGGLSAILDKHVARCAAIIRKNEEKLKKVKPGRLTLKKFWQLAQLDMQDINFKKDI